MTHYSSAMMHNNESIMFVDDSKIPRQEWPQHRNRTTDVLTVIKYLTYDPPSIFDDMPHVKKVTRWYDSLPEVYQEAIQKVLKSFESTATTEYAIKEFGLWQNYLRELR